MIVEQISGLGDQENPKKKPKTRNPLRKSFLRKNIKIWTYDVDKKNWYCDDIPRAHHDSIWRLSWAHPEFGQLIASCAEDNTIKIWEEQEVGYDPNNRWLKKASLSNSRRAVNDVKFCNRAFGLKLAAASADGFIRIYEAGDVFDLTKWDLYVSILTFFSFIFPLNT